MSVKEISGFCIPVQIDNNSKRNYFTRGMIKVGEYADSYLSLNSTQIFIKKDISQNIWIAEESSTEIYCPMINLLCIIVKVATYILIVPAILALAAKYAYKKYYVAPFINSFPPPKIEHPIEKRNNPIPVISKTEAAAALPIKVLAEERLSVEGENQSAPMLGASLSEHSAFYFNALVHDVLKSMSDIHYQKRVWVEGNGPECYSFNELTNDFFDFFAALPDLSIKYSSYGLSLPQYKELQELYKEFDSYLEKAPKDDDEIIKDPKWIAITQLAKKLYTELKKINL